MRDWGTNWRIQRREGDSEGGIHRKTGDDEQGDRGSATRPCAAKSRGHWRHEIEYQFGAEAQRSQKGAAGDQLAVLANPTRLSTPNRGVLFDARQLDAPGDEIYDCNVEGLVVVPRVQRITVLLVVLAAAPIAAIAVWSISRTMIELSDPCAAWDNPPEQPMHAKIGPHDACRARSEHAESRSRAAIITAIVPGGLLLAAMLAIAGAVLSRRRVVITAGIGMLAETLVAFTIAPLTLVAGVSILLLSKRLRPSEQSL